MCYFIAYFSAKMITITQLKTSNDGLGEMLLRAPWFLIVRSHWQLRVSAMTQLELTSKLIVNTKKSFLWRSTCQLKNTKFTTTENVTDKVYCDVLISYKTVTTKYICLMTKMLSQAIPPNI